MSSNVSSLEHWPVLCNENTQRICKEFGDNGKLRGGGLISDHGVETPCEGELSGVW